ncbi:MAG: hypothetical protein OSB62_06555 [Alphaproteobacteria bacterium]|nr:hypothetical protein [Alphaproteobacteria bacterium]
MQLIKPEDALSMPRGYLLERAKLAIGSSYLSARRPFTQEELLKAAQIAILHEKTLFQTQSHIIAYIRNFNKQLENPQAPETFRATASKKQADKFRSIR